MNPERLYKLSGYLSLFFGLVALLSVFRSKLLYLALPVSVLGMLLSIFNIFLQTKYNFEPGKYAKGYLGLFFSSLPVLFLMALIFFIKPS